MSVFSKKRKRKRKKECHHIKKRKRKLECHTCMGMLGE